MTTSRRYHSDAPRRTARAAQPGALRRSLNRLFRRLTIGILPLLPSAALALSSSNAAVAFDSIRRPTPNTILIQAHVPTNAYAILERRRTSTAAFLPVVVAVPATPGSVRASAAIPAGDTFGILRLRAVPLDAPADTDGDGIDDVYEARRSHVLDPLDPSDAQRDADGDGESNLTEYLDFNEAAPPRAETPVRYATLEELRRTTATPLPNMVYLEGYSASDDGWGGWFAWLPEDNGPADDALRVEFRPGQPGRLVRVVEAGDPVLTAWWRPASGGLADSGPPLQKALDFMASRSVRKLVINPGRYRISSRIAYETPSACPLSLVGVDDFEIIGTGATLWTLTDGEMLMLKDCHRGVVRNLGFESAGSDRSLADGNYTVISLVGNQSDLEFNGCRLQGFMHGISHLHGEKTSRRITIRGCQFVDGGDLGQQALGADGAAVSGIGDDWLVEDNYFDECARGIEVENTAKFLPIQRVIIRGNRLLNVRNLGIVAWMGGIPEATNALHQSDIVVRNNLVVGKRPRHVDPRGDTVPVMNISVNGGSRWIIQGNTCEDGDYAGISLYANQAVIEDCLVTDNVVTRMGGRGIQIYTSPELAIRGVVASNNRIRNCYDRGILVVGDHIVADGNLIEGTVTGLSIGDTSAPDILASFVVARGNTIHDIPPGFPAILVAPGAISTTITGNDIHSSEIGIRDLSGTARIEGNRFEDVATELEVIDP